MVCGDRLIKEDTNQMGLLLNGTHARIFAKKSTCLSPLLPTPNIQYLDKSRLRPLGEIVMNTPGP